MKKNQHDNYRGMDDVSKSNYFPPGKTANVEGHGMPPRRDSPRAQLQWAMKLDPDDLPTVFFSVAQKLALQYLQAASNEKDPVKQHKMIEKLIIQVDGRPVETKQIISDTFEDRLRRMRDDYNTRQAAKAKPAAAGTNAPTEGDDEF